MENRKRSASRDSSFLTSDTFRKRLRDETQSLYFPNALSSVNSKEEGYDGVFFYEALRQHKIFLTPEVAIKLEVVLAAYLEDNAEARLQLLLQPLVESGVARQTLKLLMPDILRRIESQTNAEEVLDPWELEHKQDRYAALVERTLNNSTNHSANSSSFGDLVLPAIKQEIDKFPAPPASTEESIIPTLKKLQWNNISDFYTALFHAIVYFYRKFSIPFHPVKLAMDLTAAVSEKKITNIFVLGVQFSTERWEAASKLDSILDISWKLYSKHFYYDYGIRRKAGDVNIYPTFTRIDEICLLKRMAVYVGAYFLQRSKQSLVLDEAGNQTQYPFCFNTFVHGIMPSSQIRKEIDAFIQQKALQVSDEYTKSQVELLLPYFPALGNDFLPVTSVPNNIAIPSTSTSTSMGLRELGGLPPSNPARTTDPLQLPDFQKLLLNIDMNGVNRENRGQESSSGHLFPGLPGPSVTALKTIDISSMQSKIVPPAAVENVTACIAGAGSKATDLSSATANAENKRTRAADAIKRIFDNVQLLQCNRSGRGVHNKAFPNDLIDKFIEEVAGKELDKVTDEEKGHMKTLLSEESKRIRDVMKDIIIYNVKEDDTGIALAKELVTLLVPESRKVEVEENREYSLNGEPRPLYVPLISEDVKPALDCWNNPNSIVRKDPRFKDFGVQEGGNSKTRWKEQLKKKDERNRTEHH